MRGMTQESKKMGFSREILDAIPHRQPFIMVDRVLEVVPGKRATAIKIITTDPLSSGWGSGRYYPEAFILEAMAQVGALAAAAPAAPIDGKEGPVYGFLAAISDARFLKRPEAGDTVFLELEYQAGMGGLVRFKATAKIEGQVAAESVLTFTLPS